MELEQSRSWLARSDWLIQNAMPMVFVTTLALVVARRVSESTRWSCALVTCSGVGSIFSRVRYEERTNRKCKCTSPSLAYELSTIWFQNCATPAWLPTRKSISTEFITIVTLHIWLQFNHPTDASPIISLNLALLGSNFVVTLSLSRACLLHGAIKSDNDTIFLLFEHTYFQFTYWPTRASDDISPLSV